MRYHNNINEGVRVLLSNRYVFLHPEIRKLAYYEILQQQIDPFSFDTSILYSENSGCVDAGDVVEGTDRAQTPIAGTATDVVHTRSNSTSEARSTPRAALVVATTTSSSLDFHCNTNLLVLQLTTLQWMVTLYVSVSQNMDLRYFSLTIVASQTK